MTYPGGVSGPNFAGGAGQGLAWAAVSVESVDPANNIAVVRDQLTKSWNMPLNGMRAKGAAPKEGELWIVHKQFGRWSWGVLVNGNPDGERIPMANVDGLPELNTNAQVGSARGDGELFNDVLSTLARREMRTDLAAVTVNYMYCYRAYTSRTIVATAAKFATGATARVGGNHRFGFYAGWDTSHLTVIDWTEQFQSTSANSISTWVFDQPYKVAAGAHVVFFSMVTGTPTATPSFVGLGPVLSSSFINRGPAYSTAVYKQIPNGSIPTTIDFADGTWLNGNAAAWAALSAD